MTKGVKQPLTARPQTGVI